jgi:hypothetical protein
MLPNRIDQEIGVMLGQAEEFIFPFPQQQRSKRIYAHYQKYS